jgi:signal transduction histidine kinase
MSAVNDPWPPMDATQADRLARVCRFSQIGRCVNSVTHDVNNYLGAIMAYAELVAMEPGLSDDAQRMLREITGAVRKSSDLIGNLTDLARRDRRDMRVIEPAALAERVLDLRRYELKVGHIRLETAYGSEVKPFSVDLPKAELALMYLVSNAIEAIEPIEDKRVRVEVRAENGCVMFGVADSAEAIPAETCDRMFEPGFTTKDGPHLGMGLFVARAIARAHDGDLDYQPETGFRMRIPVNMRFDLETPPD